MRTFGMLAGACGALLLSLAMPAGAHHSFAAEFDANQPVNRPIVCSACSFLRRRRSATGMSFMFFPSNCFGRSSGVPASLRLV